MTKFRKSVDKPNHGPVMEWHGGECPVPPGTPISVMFRGAYESTHTKYWQAANRPEKLDWSHRGQYLDILAYYERVPVPKPPPFGEQAAAPEAATGAIHIPRNRDEALAMRAVAQAWLDEHTAASTPEPKNSDWRNLNVALLDVNQRCHGGLTRAGIATAGAAADLGICGVLRIHNIGRKSAKEIRNALIAVGADLGERWR